MSSLTAYGKQLLIECKLESLTDCKANRAGLRVLTKQTASIPFNATFNLVFALFFLLAAEVYLRLYLCQIV